MTIEESRELDDRVPTGIEGLDDSIEGGFPRGSLILLAGSPGSGKTIASAQYLYYGIMKRKEKGIYVSFAERKETFYRNMKRFGLDFQILENQGDFRFLDIMTCSGSAVESTFDMILGEVAATRTKRLVIDSFSAMAQAFKRKIDTRIMVHLLEKMMRETACTTLMLVEIPKGSSMIGVGIEEFVADGIILFEISWERIGIRKRALIQKMRGTNHNMNYKNIIISTNGISLVPEVT